MGWIRGLMAVLLLASPVSAQLMKGKTALQLRDVIREALATGKRVDQIGPRIVKKEVVFDVTLVPNPDETGWMTLLNLTAKQYAEAKQRYEPEGYRIHRKASIRANGQQFTSTVWLRTHPPVSTLVLPNGRLPEDGEIVEKLKPIDEVVRDFLKQHNASGVTLAIAKDGELIYDRAFGWANAERRKAMEVDTQMRIADVSKAITGIAAMQLHQQGKLKLDEPFIDAMKKARFKGVSSIKDSRWKEITPRELLSHRGGFDEKATSDTMFQTSLVSQDLKLKKEPQAKEVVRYKMRRPMDFDPGSKFAYSNFGYCLLARVMEVADDRPYGSTVLHNLLRPMGLTQTKRGRSIVDKRTKSEAWYHMQREKKAAAYWTASRAQIRRAGKTVKAPDIVREPDGVFQLEAMDSSNGWISTARDLVSMVVALERKEEPLLSESIFEEMLAKPAGTKADADQWYGLGWWVKKTASGRRYWHGGSLPGTSSMLVREDSGVVWGALFNTDNSKVDGKPLAAAFDKKLRGEFVDLEWP